MKNKELKILYKMLDYNSSGIRTENDHSKDGSVFLMTNPSKPDMKANKNDKRANKYHKGRIKRTTKTFIKNRFRLNLFKIFNIEEFTSTNDRLYAITIKLITYLTIITLFLIYSIFKG